MGLNQMCINKKKLITISVVGIIIILISLAAYLIYDINHRFPEPVMYTYTFDNSANEDGLVITPLECRIYTYDNYKNEYGEASAFTEKESNSDRTRYIVFKLKFENVSQRSISYETDTFWMNGEKSGVYNGVLLEEGKKNKSTIQPGETQQFTLSTVVTAPSLIKTKWIDRLDEETFYLVYRWYPSIKRLEFDVSHD